MTPEERVADGVAAADPRMQELEQTLRETWARLPADQAVPLNIVGPFIRAGYGRGYTVGLEERLT